MPLPISRSGAGLHGRRPVFVFPVREGGRVVGFAPAGGYVRGAHAPGHLAARACVPSMAAWLHGCMAEFRVQSLN